MRQYYKLILTSAVIILGMIILVYEGNCNESTQTSRNQGPLLLGTNVWPGYEPFYLARARGYYQPQDIRLVEYSTATRVIKAFRNSAIHAAALTLDEILLLHEREVEVKIILICDISQGGDAILARPGFPTLKKLKGRRIGVEHTALGAYVLTRAMQLSGMFKKDVKIIPLEVDEHESAYLKGEVDAVVTFEPVKSRLLDAGARLIFDSRQISGEIVDALIVSPEVLRDRRPQLKKLLSGWFRTLRYMNENPKAAAKMSVGRLRLSPEAILKSYEGLKLPNLSENQKLLLGERPPLLDSMRHLIQVMESEALLSKTTHPRSLLDSSQLKPLFDSITTMAGNKF